MSENSRVTFNPSKSTRELLDEVDRTVAKHRAKPFTTKTQKWDYLTALGAVQWLENNRPD